MAPQGPWLWTQTELEQLAQELRTWAADESNLFLKQFSSSRERPFPASYFSRFSEACPSFAQTMEIVNDILEARLLKGGLKNELNHNIVRLVAVSKYNYLSERNDVAIAAARTLPDSPEGCDKLIEQATEQKRMLQAIVADAQAVQSIVVG